MYFTQASTVQLIHILIHLFCLGDWKPNRKSSVEFTLIISSGFVSPFKNINNDDLLRIITLKPRKLPCL